MDNQIGAHRAAKRRRINSSPAVQNKAITRKTVIILDVTWLEALKHLTCPQWSKMSLVCHQVNGIVQRNISRLPRQVIENITLNSQYLSFHPRFTSIASSLQKLFHPVSYIKNVAMRIVNQNMIDANFNNEDRYICCHKFELLPYTDMSSTTQKIALSLEWLERNVRSDSISFPEWMFNGIHKIVEIRAMVTNFIFVVSQKCKVQELVFSFYGYAISEHNLSSMELVNILIEDFLALPVVQGNIPTVVINHHPDKEQYRYPSNEQYRAKLGENLIGREVDSQGADALYEIENGEKRIRIAFCDRYSDLHDNFPEGHKVYLKFYTS